MARPDQLSPEIVTDSSEPFAIVLTTLAEEMRKYDEIDTRYSGMQSERGELAKKLEGVDLELPLDEQPAELAYTALSVHILTEKMRPARRDLFASENPGDLSELAKSLVGRKVLVESLVPGMHRLGTYTRDRDGETHGRSKYYEARQGRIASFRTGATYGGSITLKGRFNNFHVADPLIDRADYTPNYRITEL